MTGESIAASRVKTFFCTLVCLFVHCSLSAFTFLNDVFIIQRILPFV